ncbi:MAG: ABC transporter permease [Spirochaetaceae bacterium]|jgi:NitT/TauT family transport system permease protein|nr:ABC transporter permease [Spirochaetaceae bacterium]
MCFDGRKTAGERMLLAFRKSIAIIIFLTFWEIAPRVGLADSMFIPPLSEVIVTGARMAASGSLLPHIKVSLRRALFGFMIAAVAALPLGFLLGGWFKRFEEYLNPLLNVLAQINPFSVFPIFILLFGIGETAKIAIILWVCVWPILFGTILGVKNIDPVLLKAALAMGTSKFALFWKIVLPGAAPAIFAGLKQGAGISFFMLIAAEMIGATAGLGFLILQSQVNFQIRRLFVGVVAIALLGLFITWLLNFIEKRVITWREDSAVK